MIVTFTNQKGGVGKTTLATILAQSAITSGLKDVVMIDLDTLQHNYTDIMHGWDKSVKISDRLQKNIKENAFVIIDTPPAMGDATENAIKIADVVVAPMDRGISSIVGLQKIISKNKNTIIVINRFNNKKAMDREIYNTAVSTFGVVGVPILVLPENAWINNNINYRTTWNTNMTDKQAESFVKFIKMILAKR